MYATEPMERVGGFDTPFSLVVPASLDLDDTRTYYATTLDGSLSSRFALRLPTFASSCVNILIASCDR